jgi:hypothetical protein
MQADRMCAVFGDIVKSRVTLERAELQKRIQAAVGQVNERFREQIAVPFRIIAGDEIRGLLRDDTCSYELILAVERAIWPARMRYSVGIGGITTELSESIDAMDGPALHRASEGMDLLKNRKRAHGRLILFRSDDQARDDLLNAMTFLVDSIKSRWSTEQFQRAQLAQSGMSVAEIAGKLGVKRQAVEESLSRALYYALDDAQHQIDMILGDSSPLGLLPG